jgi:Zn finger protein HypA/HybF involved in hydrogenase expression
MVEYLDGNAIGGALGELFAVDMTTAVGQCASCGTSSAIGEARVYSNSPGLVARCPTCDEVTVRLVRGEDRAWLDLTGFTCLQLALPADR